MTTPSPLQTSQSLDLPNEQTLLLREIRLSLQKLEESSDLEQEVILTYIDIPFGSMVTFMVKWALASIPAAIIIGIVMGGCYLLMMAVVMGLGLGLGGLP
jgi:hypothetical protein